MPVAPTKSVISLTSWKARINTVGLTLFSLIKRCPGFHIVLVLAESEFPKKEKELPDTVMAFVDQGYVELLWVEQNYKAYKKFMFTSLKYKGIPIISADDDCIYTCNYAEILYRKWVETGARVIRFTKRHNRQITQGPCTLYCLPPTLIQNFLNSLSPKQIQASRDDAVFSEFLVKNGINIIGARDEKQFPFIFHDDNSPLTKGQRYRKCYARCFRG